MKHRFPYEWNLKDANFTKDKGTVFSCFACGGGSTMGYKLAGFDVLGCNEIDPKMIEAYKANHNPKYAYLEPIQTFKLRKDLPKELYNLDILDGSPPCSSFSMAGNREKDWGKEKKFREGQAEQVLDNLFFDFIDLAKELQPKIVVAENVKGLLMGDAKEYVRKIYREFDLAGYYCQHWLLNASKMGVPQRRERVFFVCLRKDIATPFLKQMDLFTIAPELKLEFKEKTIKASEILIKGPKISDKTSYLEDRFGDVLIDKDKVFNTLVTRNRYFYDLENYIADESYILAGSFPKDYDFIKNQVLYLTGMSVPPVMIANIANEIYNQWLVNIK
ncbi:DNA methyltransferase [Rhodobacteraceae phage LS06-2018-MD05]|nr:DNA methyltransferase [Rhodobacteraceae phage LS06-2018-MD05]